MLTLVKSQIPGAFIPDANSAELTQAVARKSAERAIDPCPTLSYTDVATRDELVAAAGSLSEDGFAKVRLTADITYDSFNLLKVVEGTVILDLNGHTLEGADTVVHACGEGAKIIINDSKGGGTIRGLDENNNYGVLQVKEKGTIILNKGLITTTFKLRDVMFGVIGLSDGFFKMNGGEIHTNCACLMFSSPTSMHIKGGKLRSEICCAADVQGQGSLKIYGDASVDGGIIIDVGRLTICGNASITNTGYFYDGKPDTAYENLGVYCTRSEDSGIGPITIQSAILSRVGMFGNEYHTEGRGNDLSITIEGNASVRTSLGGPVIQLLEANTDYDQKVTLKLNRETYKRYDHDTLDTLYKEVYPDKSLKPEAFTADLTVNGGIEK